MLNIGILLLITLVLIFFRGTAFLVAGLPFQILYLSIIPLFALSVLNFKSFFRQIIFLFRNTPFKYLALFIIYLYASGAFLCFMGKSSVLIFYYITVKLLPILLLVYLVPAVFIPKYLSLKKMIKIIIGIAFFIFVFGIVGFMGDLFNIKPISAVLNFISNWKELGEGVSTNLMVDETSGVARARSIFGEPQNLGWFVFATLPILFKICMSKYRIYKNEYLNFIVKISIIPLAYLNVILCMSPIALIAVFILTFIYLSSILLKYIKKYFQVILSAVFVLMILLWVVFVIAQDTLVSIIEKSYLARITNVIMAFGDFQRLVEVEGSLASRIVSFVNSFVLFLKHPLIGLGYDNSRFFMFEQYAASPLPLTKENIGRMIFDAMYGTGTWFCKATLFTLLADTGIIGTGLFYTFLIKSEKAVKQIKNNFVGLEHSFLEGLRLSYIALISISFYLYMLYDSIQIFYFGIICSFIYAAKNGLGYNQLIRKEENNDKNN